MHFYITGDTHGDFSRIAEFCEANGTDADDVMIILGDTTRKSRSGFRVCMKENCRKDSSFLLQIL